MRLVSFAGGGVGVAEEGEVADLRPGLRERLSGEPLSMLSLIEGWNELADHVKELLRSAPRCSLDKVTLDAPVPLPGSIVAAPVNYVEHMREMSEVTDISSLGLFLKSRSSVVGPGGTVTLPYTDRRFDYEGELAVIVGRKAVDVRMEDALSYVFGYSCLLDITMRGGEDRSTRKSFRTFTPLGPWIVTRDELPEPGKLHLTSQINESVRQDAPTSDMIWPVEQVLSYASSVMTLYPGDVLATGTPPGVGPISDGDHVAVEIEGVGRLEVRVSSAGAVPCPTKGAGRGPVPPPPPA